jgi:hypothetical protein
VHNSFLKQIKVSPDDLLLDPNNPRLVDCLDMTPKINDEDILSKQAYLKGKFTQSNKSEEADGESTTDIGSLYESMIQIGYVAIDRIVVRYVEQLHKYVVVEGNRRVSTIKLILEKAAMGLLKDRGENSERKLFEKNKDSFKVLEVLELKTRGLTKDEIDKRVDIILGLRHFGSVLDWKPLNRAFNAYKNYINIDPPLQKFVFEKRRLKEVATRLSISQHEVKKALETYIVFKQVADQNSDIRDDNYSLIEAALPLCNYGNYFNRNESTYEFDDISLEKLVALCQFDRRNSGVHSNALIIPEPKKFAVLGKLLREAAENKLSGIRERAASLAEAVRRGEIEESNENAGSLVMPVDKAYSLLRAEIIFNQWVPELKKLLDKQRDKLPIDKYDGEGSHLLKKQELEKTLKNIRKFFDL